MGEVYRATDSTLGRVVAVKLLAERHARDPDVRARFTREALAAARLSGEAYVVTVFDVGEFEGRPFIVMEYLDGGTVHDQLRRKRIAPERALEWLEQAAAALDAAHRHGVVHRDVKPANLLLDSEGIARVSDFGIAFAAGMDTLTLPGTVLGTAGYLSPEQARGEPATPASDRYALGVVAFELLTGRRPYAADTPVTEAVAHLNSEIPSAEAIAPELPPGIDAVFRRALAKDPRERPGTATELVRELRQAFEDGVAPTLVATAARTEVHVHHASRRPGRRVVYAAVAVVLLGAGLALAALLGVAGDGGPDTVTRVKTVVSTPTTTTTTTTQEATPTEDGAALDAAGYERMQAGDYAGALPLLERAVRALDGTGLLDEAYAKYNLAYTRFALGSCDDVLQLLYESEAIQGHRDEIDALRRRAAGPCGGEENEGPPGKAKGHGKKGGEG